MDRVFGGAVPLDFVVDHGNLGVVEKEKQYFLMHDIDQTLAYIQRGGSRKVLESDDLHGIHDAVTVYHDIIEIAHTGRSAVDTTCDRANNSLAPQREDFLQLGELLHNRERNKSIQAFPRC